MLTQPELDEMRTTSTSALPDTCTISRPSTGGVLDPVTGVWTASAGSTIYTGPGRVRVPTTMDEVEAIFGDTQITKQRYVGTFPWDLPAVAIEDVVHVTVGSDPGIAGRSFRVLAVSAGSWLIDRRIGLEVVE